MNSHISFLGLNKKISYNPTDYACIDETKFWVVDEDEPRS